MRHEVNNRTMGKLDMDSAFLRLLLLFLAGILWKNSLINSSETGAFAFGTTTTRQPIIRKARGSRLQNAKSFLSSVSNDSEISFNNSTATQEQGSSVLQALELLQSQWSLRRNTHQTQPALENCPRLVELIVDGKLSRLDTVGRIPIYARYTMVQRHPELLANVLSSSRLQTMQQLFQQQLNWTETEYNRFVSQPKTRAEYRRWTRSNTRHVLHLLQRHFSLTNAQASQIIRNKPIILSTKAIQIQAKADYFTNDLQLTDQERNRLLRTWPVILKHSISNQLQPNLSFLKNELGLTVAWRKLVTRYPQCLTYSVDRLLRPNVHALHDVCFLERSTDVQRVVALFPPSLWLRSDLLRTKVRFLQDSLNLTNTQIRNVLVTFPQVLGLSVENNLKPKIEFLIESVVEFEQLQEFVLYQPALLAYSLENRLRPRIQQLQEKDVSFGYTPPYLMSLSNDKFQHWLDVHTSDWCVMSEAS